MMGVNVAGRHAGWVFALAALALGACSQQQDRPRGTAAPVKAAVPSEAVWHVRVGLNVAALSCRGKGRTPVAAAYRQVLSRHAKLLDAAHGAEQKRYGASGYDRHATRLYNRFANQRSPTRFCSTAAEVAKRAGAMDSAAFASAAPAMLGQLRRWAG